MRVGDIANSSLNAIARTYRVGLVPIVVTPLSMLNFVGTVASAFLKPKRILLKFILKDGVGRRDQNRMSWSLNILNQEIDDEMRIRQDSKF